MNLRLDRRPADRDCGPHELGRSCQRCWNSELVGVVTLEEFTAAAAKALAGNGPWVIVAKVVAEKPPVQPKLMDGRENKYRFVRYIEQTEGRIILKPSIVGREER